MCIRTVFGAAIQYCQLIKYLRELCVCVCVLLHFPRAHIAKPMRCALCTHVRIGTHSSLVPRVLRLLQMGLYDHLQHNGLRANNTTASRLLCIGCLSSDWERVGRIAIGSIYATRYERMNEHTCDQSPDSRPTGHMPHSSGEVL